MNAELQTAFQAGAGYPATDLALTVMLLICTLTLLWNSWVLLNTYKGWANRTLSAEAFAKGALRLALVSGIVVFLATT
ncbi:TIGR03758 family integrating conjugative element protein [Pseudomonas putida]|uniref:TIGR03758 family integrating conjugative element protein n=1 Tax=Pseudomonas putida TaxID=303 RepID=UPI0023634E7A|nr:TIGR03758 family integrating conjugative element protein [Pseudomonas putida]MDD2052767.1 TIGR03758 family integrating conjugative element protein [Pseudomonas putida]